MRPLTDEQRWRIVFAWLRLKSIRAVVRSTGLSYHAVRHWVQTYIRTRHVQPAKRTGPKQLVSVEAARKAKELLLSTDCHGGKDAARTLHSLGLTPKVLSAQTIIRAAKRQAVRDGDPIRAVRGKPAKQLTQDTMDKRLRFAVMNLRRAWQRVMFTDRKKFLFIHPGCKVKSVAWARKGEGQPVAVVNHPSALNVYCGLTPHGLTATVEVAGSSKHTSTYTNKKGQPAKNITSKEYKAVMMETLLPEGERLMSGAGLSSWVYQQDNDPTHSAAQLIIKNYNRGYATRIELLPKWPPNSPDLSPIENLWGYVQRRVYRRGCKTFDLFKDAVLEELAAVPQHVLSNLYASMAQRMAAVIKKKGGKTKY